MNTISRVALCLLSLCAVSSATPSFASEINCTIAYGGDQDNTDKDYSALLVDVVRGTCERGRYSIELSGIGVGLRVAAGTALGFSCPFSDSIAGTYGGLKADLSVLVGLDLGLFVGTHGVCALGGANGMSLGINLSGSRLKIVDHQTSKNASAQSASTDSVALLDGNATKVVPADDAMFNLFPPQGDRNGDKPAI